MSAARFPYYSRRIAQCSGNWTTGIMAAALAADAAIASMRVGPTQTVDASHPGIKAWVTGLEVKVYNTVAWTAVQQFGLYLSKFSAAAMAGGTAKDPLRHQGTGASMPDSVCKTGGTFAGDFRRSDTAALTVAGVTIDPVKIPIYGWGALVGPTEYPERDVDLRDNPIRLDVGEGLALFNQIVWPAAGTAVIQCTVFWDEAFD